jgi:hypothetical protein
MSIGPVMFGRTLDATRGDGKVLIVTGNEHPVFFAYGVEQNSRIAHDRPPFPAVSNIGGRQAEPPRTIWRIIRQAGCLRSILSRQMPNREHGPGPEYRL